MARFVEKPEEVDAFQFTYANVTGKGETIPQWFEDAVVDGILKIKYTKGIEDSQTGTLMNIIPVLKDDWIVRGRLGDINKVSKADFEKKYSKI